MRSLAERVHISRANAYARVERLMREGVITKFTVDVDHQRAGLGTSAYITVNVDQHAWRDFRDTMSRMPEVQHVALVGGEFDVILLVRTTDNEALRRLVFDHLQMIPGVLSTRTLLIFEERER